MYNSHVLSDIAIVGEFLVANRTGEKFRQMLIQMASHITKGAVNFTAVRAGMYLVGFIGIVTIFACTRVIIIDRVMALHMVV